MLTNKALRKVLASVPYNTAVVVFSPGEWGVGIPDFSCHVSGVNTDCGILYVDVNGDSMSAGEILEMLDCIHDLETICAGEPVEDGMLWDGVDAYVEADGPLDYGDPIPDPVVIILVSE